MTTNYSPAETQATASASALMPVDYSSYEDDDLLDAFDYWKDRQTFALSMLGHLEQELVRRMTERGAKSVPSETFVCELETKDGYDQPSFGPLKEIFNEKDLKTCFTPAHDEIAHTEDKWNTVKLKALAARYGAEALAVVERARITGAPRLLFKRRE